MPHSFRTALMLVVTLGLVGCRAATPPPTTSLEPRELSKATHWVRNSAEYQALVRQVYIQATDQLEEMVENRRGSGGWAVALDADETVVDNSQYQKELDLSGRKYESATWAEWVSRQEAPPLPGALAFLAKVQELGGKIAIVTNRKIAECPDTEANFEKYNIPYDVILCRGDDRRKEARWKQIEDGTAKPGLPPLEILLWMGDNIHDFPNLEQDLRQADDAAFEEFGRRYFVTPNPTYGSWAGNPKN